MIVVGNFEMAVARGVADRLIKAASGELKSEPLENQQSLINMLSSYST